VVRVRACAMRVSDLVLERKQTMYDQLPDFLKIVLGLACLALLIAGLVALWRRTPDPDDQDDF
jgi:hypothetical protein